MTKEQEQIKDAINARPSCDADAERVHTYHLTNPERVNIEVESSGDYVDKARALFALREFFAPHAVEFSTQYRSCGCETCDYGAVFTMEFEVAL